MARPRLYKTVEDNWYDCFANWSEADRAAALKVLTALHGVLSREARRKAEPAAEPSLLDDEDETERARRLV